MTRATRQIAQTRTFGRAAGGDDEEGFGSLAIPEGPMALRPGLAAGLPVRAALATPVVQIVSIGYLRRDSAEVKFVRPIFQGPSPVVCPSQVVRWVVPTTCPVAHHAHCVQHRNEPRRHKDTKRSEVGCVLVRITRRLDGLMVRMHINHEATNTPREAEKNDACLHASPGWRCLKF